MFPRCGTVGNFSKYINSYKGYVAPEVINIKNFNLTYGPVCDIFSLGIIFYMFLLGKSPFDGISYNQILI